jgi:hypothetical protein
MDELHNDDFVLLPIEGSLYQLQELVRGSTGANTAVPLWRVLPAYQCSAELGTAKFGAHADANSWSSGNLF